MATPLTRREKLLAAGKLTRQLIALEARKITTLCQLDLAIEQALATASPGDARAIDDLLDTLDKGLRTHERLR